MLLNIVWVSSVFLFVEITSSKSEARRLISQNGISINGKKENNINKIIDKTNDELVIQKGKKTFVKIKFL